MFFVSWYFVRSTDWRAYSTGVKYSVSLGKCLVRGVHYVGSVLFHPWYCVQEKGLFRWRTDVSCGRARSVCNPLVSRKWAVAFVNVSNQNTNAQIVVSSSRLKSVVAVLGYGQIMLILKLLMLGREEMEALNAGSRECIIAIKYYVYISVVRWTAGKNIERLNVNPCRYQKVQWRKLAKRIRRNMNIRQKTLFPWTDWSYYVHFKLHTEFLITAHCKLPLKCTLTQNCGKIGVLTLSYFHFFIHELPNSIRLYFLKRGQPTKHRFYRRSKKKKTSQILSLLQMNFFEAP